MRPKPRPSPNLERRAQASSGSKLQDGGMRTRSLPSSIHARRDLSSDAAAATTETQGTRSPSQSSVKRWTVHVRQRSGFTGEQAVNVRCSRGPSIWWPCSRDGVSIGRPPNVVQAYGMTRSSDATAVPAGDMDNSARASRRVPDLKARMPIPATRNGESLSGDRVVGLRCGCTVTGLWPVRVPRGQRCP